MVGCFFKSQKSVTKPVEEAMSGNKYRELIADLDWWSKYYITKQDAAAMAYVSLPLTYAASNVM